MGSIITVLHTVYLKGSNIHLENLTSLTHLVVLTSLTTAVIASFQIAISFICQEDPLMEVR